MAANASSGATLHAPRKVALHSTKRVIVAASAGTVFEWYDFVLYGSLAGVLAKRFFAGVDPATGFIFALLTFAVGFLVRPLGALVFGRIGDLVGRKKTFMITIVIMGSATVGVGLLPDYASIGIAAPIILIILRTLQGLAIGGEYGGAATYVAEHSSHERRARNTSWIVSTGTLGLLLSFGVILWARTYTGDQFESWGWRLPFLFSLPMLIASIWIRRAMDESPAFQRLKDEHKLSKRPLTEAFTDPENVKRLFIAFGVCAGQSAVYYTAALYPTFFLTQTLKVDPTQVNTMVVFATLSALPMFLLVGWLADHIGRRPIMIFAYAASLVALLPIFHGLTHFANPALAAAQARNPVVVEADSADCSFMFNPLGTRKFTTSCDVARQTLAAAGVSYEVSNRTGQRAAIVRIGDAPVESFDSREADTKVLAANTTAFTTTLKAKLAAAGYPAKADPAQFNSFAVYLLLLVPMVLAIIAITPVPTLLVEMFPARIRYTSMSFPFHLAAGWVGGLLPTITFALSTFNGNIYFGIWYPMAWTAVSLLVCVFFLKETRDVDINE